MNLYLIQQSVIRGYDTYSEAVICAENEEIARNTHPEGHVLGSQQDWFTWPSNAADVQVHLLGVAAPDVSAGVICASFHAD
jgi:hypothetical protein